MRRAAPAGSFKTTAASGSPTRGARRRHAPLLENCVVERALYDARGLDLRTSRGRRRPRATGRRALFRRVDSLAELDASGRNRAQAPRRAVRARRRGTAVRVVDAADDACGTGRGVVGRAGAVGDVVVDDELLGRGSYGAVRRCTRKSDGGSSRARPSGCGAARAGTGCTPRSRRRAAGPPAVAGHEVFYEKQRVHLIFDLCTGGAPWAF